ncbi:recombinase RecB [Kaistella solincola]|uniref:Recombinase RecB n=2 Tax=Kaistella solincola TaxID=510955 RepID=A0ABR4ZNY3_9FLAO|nr:recombinase RecB [Kaistella solincola]
MRKQKGKIIFSASDLANHIHCKHLTNLNHHAVTGVLEKSFTSNRSLILLRERGEEFEQAILSEYENGGKTVFKVDKDPAVAYKQTVAAMKSGYDFIYQARLSTQKWQGWADFLRKVEAPSNLGDWSYEVIDTKLSSNTRAGAILQIALYSEIIGEIQGRLPEYMYVKNPDEELEYRVNDYISYLRLIKKRLNAATQVPLETYPEPCSHCDICDWWEHCNKIRRNDDHLSFIAGMGSSQIKEVKSQGIHTLEAMAAVALPLPFKPKKGSKETFTKLREQARLQEHSRTVQKPVYEILERKPNTGFFTLPKPSKGDIYLDFEGDPLVEPTGLEYLFGWVFQDQYFHMWVHNMEQEKDALIQFIDFVFEKKETYPDLHIYHFASYESAALKRMMGKYAVKENEIDILLRTQKFVDLHRVLKQSIRAGVERYSLKDLEAYHGFVRQIDLRTVSGFKADLEFFLESGNTAAITVEMSNAVLQYNQDDCFSTKNLHLWLERERQKLVDAGEEIERPVPREGEEPEHITAHLERIQPIYDALLENVPVDFTERSAEQQAKYILAHMLDWYRREEKSIWWEHYRLMEADEEELLDEKAALTFLEFTGKRMADKKSFIDEYKFPSQEYDLKTNKDVKIQGYKTKIKIIDINENDNLIYLRKGPSISEIHPVTVYKDEYIDSKKKQAQIINIAEWFVENGFEGRNNSYAATRDLLLNSFPRTKKNIEDHEDLLTKGVQWASVLDNSYLAIQGPPGSGKSFTGSHMILDLIKKGHKIGITAMSHKVIINLLKKVKEVAEKENFSVKILYKGDGNEESNEIYEIENDIHKVGSKIKDYQVVAGTSFMWSDNVFTKSLDYLFIDEAGQFALIDTVVVSHAAKNLVLLGDHQQLKQPIKGVHPEGTEVSALEHLLQEHKTIPENKGLFLDKTWRMHPNICEFDSEMFYEAKLFSVEKMKHQRIEGNTIFEGSGLFYKTVEHEGNTNQSLEEIGVIEAIVKDLTKGDVFWYDQENERHLLKAKDIKIISPYNSNVYELQKKLPEFEIGTVDRFQGQEAPVVIYSMASSSPEDAPRGMEFLYSSNRFNVAVSRARATFILVGNPRLFEPDCQSPNQMKLANPFCRYLEVATKKN